MAALLTKPEVRLHAINFTQCWAALFGVLAVAMGAFAAHKLQGSLSAGQLAAVQTAVQYQMWHALALLAVARMQRGRWQQWATAFFVAGILCFSGSLYVLVFTAWRPGLLTPVGGVLLIAGWLTLLFAACSSQVRRH